VSNHVDLDDEEYGIDCYDDSDGDEYLIEKFSRNEMFALVGFIFFVTAAITALVVAWTR
jgi:hypothetical protein